MPPPDVKPWIPVPLRLALGIGLIVHGGIKLFVDGGHENISHMISLLGLPLPNLLGWVVGVVEFAGGVGMLLGLYFKPAVVINILNILGLLVFGYLAGGIPEPLPDGDPLPAYREAFMILAGLVTLLMLGAGRWSLDHLRRGNSGY